MITLLNLTEKKDIKIFKKLLEQLISDKKIGPNIVVIRPKEIIPNDIKSIEIVIEQQNQPQKFTRNIPKENITFVADVSYEKIDGDSIIQRNCRVLPWKIDDVDSQQILQNIIDNISDNTKHLVIIGKIAGEEEKDIEDNLTSLTSHSLDIKKIMDDTAQKSSEIESLKDQLEKEKQNVINEKNARVQAEDNVEYEKKARIKAEENAKYHKMYADKYLKDIEWYRDSNNEWCSKLAWSEKNEKYYRDLNYHLNNEVRDQKEQIKILEKDRDRMQYNADWYKKYYHDVSACNTKLTQEKDQLQAQVTSLTQNQVEWDVTQSNKSIVKCKGFTGTITVQANPQTGKMNTYID